MPAIVLLAAAPLGARAKRWLRGGVVLAGIMSLAIYAQALAPVLPIAAPRIRSRAHSGGSAAAASADSAARVASSSTRATTWLGGDRYQEAAELAFYAPGTPATFAMNLAGRVNQYDLWPRFPEAARRGTISSCSSTRRRAPTRTWARSPRTSVRRCGASWSALRRGSATMATAGCGRYSDGGEDGPAAAAAIR